MRLVEALRYRVERRMRPLPTPIADDDFDWRTYNDTYRRQIAEMEQSLTSRLAPGDARLEGDVLRLRDGLPPLHPNHRVLYETVMLLEPDGVIEAGCGGGDHLHNLSTLLPDVDLRGLDRSAEQLAFAQERNPELVDRVRHADLTLPLPTSIEPADVAYTQAVVMHIKTGNGHRVALTNLFRLARRQVVLMENWGEHDFMADIQALYRLDVLGWEDLHLYVRRSPEMGDAPHIMVASRVPLDWEPLEDYGTLRSTVR
jgi:SAM-dependent methyltransferase